VHVMTRYLKLGAAVAVMAVLITFQLVAPKSAAARASTAAPKSPDPDAHVLDIARARAATIFKRRSRQALSTSHPLSPARYIVRAGDTLSAIAPRFGMTWMQLWYKNRAQIGTDPNLIYPGQRFIVTGPIPVVPASFGQEFIDPVSTDTPKATHLVASSAPVTAPQPAVGGNLALWTEEAFSILERTGTPAGLLSTDAEDVIATCESADGANEVGDGSFGINQTDPDTFAAYALPGMGQGDASIALGAPIWDNVWNMVAAIRYAVATYGSLYNVPGVRSTGGNPNDCAQYVGY
jgi:LysM repeat protein